MSDAANLACLHQVVRPLCMLSVIGCGVDHEEALTCGDQLGQLMRLVLGVSVRGSGMGGLGT